MTTLEISCSILIYTIHMASIITKRTIAKMLPFQSEIMRKHKKFNTSLKTFKF